MYLVFSVAGLLIMVAALVDMITIDSTRVKHLPKMAWIILVILLPAIGGIIWFAVGREYLLRADRGSFGDPGRWADPERAPFSHPDLAVRDAEAELAALDREIAQSERAERIRKLESELEEKQRERGSGS
jgi:Phospholipase_D-nuclease N-terminal